MRRRRKEGSQIGTDTPRLDVPSPPEGPIREFVYLDEVSVRSLLASILGALDVEMTVTETHSSESAIEGGLSAGLGLSKAEIKARQQAARGSENQVLRRSLIQADFRQLVEVTNSRRLFSGPGEPRSNHDVDSPVLRAMRDLQRSGGAIAGHQLRRGALLEFEAEVSADAVFQASEAASMMVDIMREDAASFGLTDVRQISAGTRMLSKVLAGLVPIRCKAVSHVRASWGDEVWLVDRRSSGDLKGIGVSIDEVTVAGVAESDLFWKDPRRVLFSGFEYTILCRLARNGFQDEWTPIKLSEMLRLGDVNLGTVVTEAANTIVSGKTSQGTSPFEEAAKHLGVLVAYCDGLEAATGVRITLEELLERVSADRVPVEPELAVEWFRAFVEPVEALAIERATVEVDRRGLSNARLAAVMAMVGLALEANGGTAELVAGGGVGPYLDAEFVAIYW